MATRRRKKNKEQKGLSTGVKVGIGVAAAALIAAIAIPSLTSGNQGSTSKNLHYAVTDTLNTQDLSLMTDNISFNVAGNSQEGLLSRNSDGSPSAGLAEKWEHNAEGTEWTFTLRDGLTWSNGDKIKASDFVYAWQRTVDPKTKSEYAYLFSGIKNADEINSGKNTDLSSLGIKADGDKKVIVTLDKPLPQFENLMSFPTFYPQNEKFSKSQSSKVGTSSDAQVYSGPFKLEGWNGSNNNFKLVKNDKYWDAKNVKSPEIDLEVIKDPSAALAKYKKGEIDSVGLNTPEDVAANKSSNEFVKIPESTTLYLSYNISKNKALANEKIRQGLDKAINRQEIVDSITSGISTVANTFTPVDLSKTASGQDFATTAAAETSSSHAFNIDEAKKLIDQGKQELGVSDLSFTYTADADSPTTKAIAEYLQQNFEKIGVKLELKYVPFKQRLEAAKNGNFEIIAQLWGADYAEPTTFLDLETTDNPQNAGKFSDTAYDALLNSAHGKNALDLAARTQDEIAAEKILAEKTYISPIYFRATPSLQRSNVTGVQRFTSGVNTIWKSAERTK